MLCKKQKLLLYVWQWFCAETSAIPDEHCILSCKLMFKGSFIIIESVDWQFAYSTLNYSKNGIKASCVGLSRCSSIAL